MAKQPFREKQLYITIFRSHVHRLPSQIRSYFLSAGRITARHGSRTEPLARPAEQSGYGAQRLNSVSLQFE
jgi:hypothetical protein